MTADIIEYDYDNDNYYDNTVEKISGTDNYNKRIINNGIKFTVSENQDVYEFDVSTIFSFKYIKNGADKNVYGRYDNDSDLAPSTLGNGKINKYRELIFNFLFGNNNQTTSFTNENSVDIYATYKLTDNADVLFCRQKINGHNIINCDFTVVISGDKIQYVSGIIIFNDTYKNYSTTMYDQINILFIEKQYIDEYRASAADDLYAAEESAEFTISSITFDYCINWNATRNKYYLIPAWTITYQNEEVRIRNAANGNIYG
jgi:hypothetical protein